MRLCIRVRFSGQIISNSSAQRRFLVIFHPGLKCSIVTREQKMEIAQQKAALRLAGFPLQIIVESLRPTTANGAQREVEGRPEKSLI
jgi:hypothetical protein